MGVSQLIHGDAHKVLPDIPDKTVAAVVFDPPYEIGFGNWDVAPNIPVLLNEFWRVLKPTGFVVFTHQMPNALDWLMPLRRTLFQFRNEIIWAKRKIGRTPGGLARAHENVYVYTKGTPDYHEVKGRFSDVKLPGLMYGLADIEGMQRHIDSLHRERRTGEPDMVKRTGKKRHEAHSGFDDRSSRRAPEEVNFTDVWSFLPENHKNHSGKYAHPTMKPLLLFERLIQLTTAPGDLVLDPFAGSGTTGIAAQRLDRNYILIEKDAEFYKAAQARLAEPYTPEML